MITFSEQMDLQPDQTLWLVGLGDVHYNLDECDHDKFERFVTWCVAEQEAGNLVKLIGMGDYTDLISTSERAVIIGAKGGAGLHDGTLAEWDRTAIRAVKQFTKAVAPIGNEAWLGLLDGHHHWQFAHHKTIGPQGEAMLGHNSNEWIASALRTRYLGTDSLFTLSFPHTQDTIEGYAVHGFGAGQTVAAKINRRVKVGQNWPQTNLVFMGHDHTRIAHVDTSMAMKDGQIVAKRKYLIGTGSFLRSYTIGDAKGGYIEALGVPPVDLGAVPLRVQLVKQNKQYTLDVTALL